MEWIKIEKKWADMARRMQGTVTVTRTDKIGGTEPGRPTGPPVASPADINDTGEMAERALV